MENSKNCQLEKFQKFSVWKIKNIKKFHLYQRANLKIGTIASSVVWILKIPKSFVLENSKNRQYGKFQNFAISKIRKIFNLINSKNWEIRFISKGKYENWQNCE